MILLVTNGELKQASIGTDEKKFGLHSAPIQLLNKYPLLLVTSSLPDLNIMFRRLEALVASTLSLTSPAGMHTLISSYLLLLTYNCQMLPLSLSHQMLSLLLSHQMLSLSLSHQTLF